MNNQLIVSEQFPLAKKFQPKTEPSKTNDDKLKGFFAFCFFPSSSPPNSPTTTTSTSWDPKGLSRPHVWSPNRNHPPRHCNSPRPASWKNSGKGRLPRSTTSTSGSRGNRKLNSWVNCWFGARARWFPIWIEVTVHVIRRSQESKPPGLKPPIYHQLMEDRGKKHLSCANNIRKMTFSKCFYTGWPSGWGAVLILIVICFGFLLFWKIFSNSKFFEIWDMCSTF